MANRFLDKGFEWEPKHTQASKAVRGIAKYKPLYRAIAKLATNTSHCNSSDPVGHTLVLGTTRVGKTRLAELIVAQEKQWGEALLRVGAIDLRLISEVGTGLKTKALSHVLPYTTSF